MQNIQLVIVLRRLASPHYCNDGYRAKILFRREESITNPHFPPELLSKVGVHKNTQKWFVALYFASN